MALSKIGRELANAINEDSRYHAEAFALQVATNELADASLVLHH